MDLRGMINNGKWSIFSLQKNEGSCVGVVLLRLEIENACVIDCNSLFRDPGSSFMDKEVYDIHRY